MNKPLRQRDLRPYQPSSRFKLRIRAIDRFVIDPNLVAARTVSCMFYSVGRAPIAGEDLAVAEEALKRIGSRTEISEESWLDEISAEFGKLRG